MEKKKTPTKRILFWLAALLVSFPLIQENTPFMRVKALRGAVEEVPRPKPSYPDWFSGDYAKEYDKYLTHNFGMRAWFVRLDNQIGYSLFGETRARNVVVGKEGYLYEQNYIDAYTGKDFLGNAAVAEKVRKLRVVQDSLHARGKHLLVILAAGKASFFPEYIPDHDMEDARLDSTNYHAFANELQRQGVEHIDFNAWFATEKDQSEYPLYPKTGIHWSLYGMTLAADSIAKHTERMTGWDLPDIQIGDIEYVDESRGADDDIEQALNLFTSFDKYKLAYPKVSFDKKDKDRPRNIMIADSYYWAMYSMGMPSEVFEGGQFWYYNSQVYPVTFEQSTVVGDLDLGRELAATDIVMIMGTEGNYKRFPWGAEDILYEYLADPAAYLARKEEERIKSMVTRIRNDKDWLEGIRKKAEEKGVPLDTMLRRDAIYMLGKQ